MLRAAVATLTHVNNRDAEIRAFNRSFQAGTPEYEKRKAYPGPTLIDHRCDDIECVNGKTRSIETYSLCEVRTAALIGGALTLTVVPGLPQARARRHSVVPARPAQDASDRHQEAERKRE